MDAGFGNLAGLTDDTSLGVRLENFEARIDSMSRVLVCGSLQNLVFIQIGGCHCWMMIGCVFEEVPDCEVYQRTK